MEDKLCISPFRGLLFNLLSNFQDLSVDDNESVNSMMSNQSVESIDSMDSVNNDESVNSMMSNQSVESIDSMDSVNNDESVNSMISKINERSIDSRATINSFDSINSMMSKNNERSFDSITTVNSDESVDRMDVGLGGGRKKIKKNLKGGSWIPPIVLDSTINTLNKVPKFQSYKIKPFLLMELVHDFANNNDSAMAELATNGKTVIERTLNFVKKYNVSDLRDSIKKTEEMLKNINGNENLTTTILFKEETYYPSIMRSDQFTPLYDTRYQTVDIFVKKDANADELINHHLFSESQRKKYIFDCSISNCQVSVSDCEKQCGMSDVFKKLTNKKQINNINNITTKWDQGRIWTNW